MSHAIPVIDFSRFGLGVEDPDVVEDAALTDLVGEVQSALSKYGFLYLSHHGIPKTTLDAVRLSCDKFFDLPAVLKEKYKLSKGDYHGWIPEEEESLDPGKPGDMKETFNYIPQDNSEKWPTEEIPSFVEDVEAFFQCCIELSNRVLSIISLGLKQERHFFKRYHRHLGGPNNQTTLRALHYPAVHPNRELKAGQMRLGEHADYGSITLLYQDDVGGLEVMSPDGVYIAATPIQGTVLVNIGDAMQRWTADKLLSNKHRVVPPTSAKQQRARRSFAFFVIPDDDVQLKCLDGSDKYAGVTMAEYIQEKFINTNY